MKKPMTLSDLIMKLLSSKDSSLDALVIIREKHTNSYLYDEEIKSWDYNDSKGKEMIEYLRDYFNDKEITNHNRIVTISMEY